MIKAIETSYKGYRFRSRLEARWAVFFDTLPHVKYEYEPEGYELPDGSRYLPDFYLTYNSTFVEIKPDISAEKTRIRCAALARVSRRNVILIEGSPSVQEVTPCEDLFGYDVKVPREYSITYFIGTTRDILYSWATHFFTENFYSLAELLQENGYKDADFDGGIESAYKLIELDKDYYRKKYGKEHRSWIHGISYNNLCFANGDDWRNRMKDDQSFRLALEENQSKAGQFAITHDDEFIQKAMIAGRSARFEFGEQG